MNHARTRLAAILLLLGLAIGLRPSDAMAQSGSRCFHETGYCIAGRIKEYWEQNGGLAVFGLPITPLQTETIEGRTLQAQWFERHRLELHPENRWPYDVLLGRVGAERVAQQRHVGKDLPAGPDCQVFAETGHAVCGAFLAAWQAAGLNVDGDPPINAAESLALFGLPLSDARIERLADGVERQVQWFERARFELHPENAPPYTVLFGLLGRELGPKAAPAAALRATAPARLAIDAIGLDAAIVPVGLDNAGHFIVPDHDIGWYNASAAPGAGENIVLWGHVLRFMNAPHIPAPFARLKELAPGAAVTLVDDLGITHRYRVIRQVSVTPDQVGFVLPQGREMVTMISCYGESVIVNGAVVDMTHRLITIAEPAGR